MRPKQCHNVSKCANVEALVLVVMANTAIGALMASKACGDYRVRTAAPLTHPFTVFDECSFLLHLYGHFCLYKDHGFPFQMSRQTPGQSAL